MNKLVVRPATEDDIGRMYDISCSIHLSSLYKTLIPHSGYDRFCRFYTPDPVKQARYTDKISDRLSSPDWRVWIADSAGEAIGFTMTYETEDSVALRGLFVDIKWQGRSIGKELFKKSLKGHNGTKPIFLEVIENNERAKTMYENAGFLVTNVVLKTFYNAPMIQMRKY